MKILVSSPRLAATFQGSLRGYLASRGVGITGGVR